MKEYLQVVKFRLKAFLIKVLGKYLRIKISTSQTGEDEILEFLLRDQSNVFYVDVGCNHPVLLSNTLRFYLNSGKGICIDANENLVKLYQKVRKRDIVILSLISNKSKEVEFHVSDDHHAISTADPNTFASRLNRWGFNRKVNMKTRSLTSILKDNLPPNKKIDLLSIDVEGMDFDALKSIDLRQYRPSIIIIEIHDLNIQNGGSQNEIVSYLKDFDYYLTFYATINAYFVSVEYQK